MGLCQASEATGMRRLAHCTEHSTKQGEGQRQNLRFDERDILSAIDSPVELTKGVAHGSLPMSRRLQLIQKLVSSDLICFQILDCWRPKARQPPCGHMANEGVQEISCQMRLYVHRGVGRVLFFLRGWVVVSIGTPLTGMPSRDAK